MIDYLDAKNGGLTMYAGLEKKGWSNTVEGVAQTLNTHGVAESMMGSSSMDFASKNGFTTDDGAMLLLKRALELID